jgi:hypothetical protein
MLKKLLLASLFLFSFSSAKASLISFDGNIASHNDVIIIEFSLFSDTTDVRVWTDSFLSGLNFDPITALWTAAGDLIELNDDDDSIDPVSQTFFDSGFYLPTLDAGDYLFTIATYPNFAVGSTIAGGFTFDNEAPIALADWCQPSSSCNMGTFWSVQLDGVDSASAPTNNVPEPHTLFLMCFGIFGLLLRSKLKTKT